MSATEKIIKFMTSNNDRKPDPPYLNYTANRPVDPKVARLKQLRKEEKMKKMNDVRAKKGLKPMSENPVRSKKNVKSTIPIARYQPQKQPKPLQQSQQPKKKMSFNELMKKASNIDSSKLKVSIPHKSHDVKPRSRAPTNPAKDSQQKTKTPPRESPPPNQAPLPTRQPSAKVQELLKKKKVPKKVPTRYEDEYDSFVESDEEDLKEEGYDREEIWAMFNKGKKRSYNEYDYDSDDMEATGGEIFDEESKSKRIAQQEDLEELETEKRLARLKKQRKNV